MAKVKKGYTIVITSDEMGKGEAEVGQKLLGAFVHTVSEREAQPEYLLLYNKGVFLANNDSDTLEDLQVLEENGVKILVCGLCVDYYNLKEKHSVGEISNMGQFVEVMETSDHLVSP